MAIIKGSDYLERINKLQNEVWIGGEKVTGAISEHPAFKGIMKSKAALYDLYHHSDKKDLLTCWDEKTNEYHSFSYSQPKTKEQLRNRRQATQLLARESGGTMGRSPDYINTAIMSLGSGGVGMPKPYGDNARKIFEEAREKDFSFTHTFINPQVNRSKHYVEYSNEKIIGAKVIDETEEGAIIHGARLLATQGGITDQLLVLPAGGNFIEPSFVYGFAIPSNTPGLKFLCRESYAHGKTSSYDYPLTSHFEEGDAVVVFDHVLVPWERIFIYSDPSQVQTMYDETNMNVLLLYQAVSRQAVKSEWLLGLSEWMVRTINVVEHQHIHEKMSEMIISLEIMNSLLIAAEEEAQPNKHGTMIPDIRKLGAACSYYQKTYPRLVDALQQIGASGFISLPSEADFHSSIKEDLHQYLQAANEDAYERVRMFRLAWDLTMSPFGSRQTQYERFFFGDQVRLSSSLYMNYPKEPFVQQVQSFLKKR
ncbi:4-hydroxyphenylacetate 3-monooxygenase, oxygenase component [Halalkalibacterium halodurans]|jgi:4-hydroxyphenylacetate 3-monooxygenase|uniref:4-hydroxyphenylacetate 3-monooxygenase n=2 Tax=Halalkalibacterium halodurans TaxID=86665 RepID=A0A0M0KFF3_ALKHA|nr:4-hydroxyphenylacetate 3-monooxygenase, oxygenase component [Halalkalibacterium halodurans]MED4163365.1 4-hydroxyphenylacetate 3-monooxygenase, oxygenase component [Halalkalibacterium halodurans]TES57382.1 4-hydroxyphenylacetate 3-monooxygenase, oxygenase component [Halalkalibacterium halodurans]TPE69532.1 4-hydroxyphenylacetate 3-monooxygenase, oxygenase component [Halalkalibacterium halodurans]